MRPVKTEHTNTELTHPQADPLPVERLEFLNERTQQREPGYESTWQPDDGERKAILNGAAITLSIWGSAHPRVKLEVGEPDLGVMRIYSHDHVALALPKFLESFGAYMAEVETRAAADEPIPEDAERGARTIELFWEAIDATRSEAERKAARALSDASHKRNGGGSKP